MDVTTTPGSVRPPEQAWQAFVEAARALAEVAVADVCVVHHDEVSPRIEFLISRASGRAGPHEGAIIQAAARSRERTAQSTPAFGGNVQDAVAAATSDGLEWRGIPWDGARTLVIPLPSGQAVLAWAAREVRRYRELARAEAGLDAVGDGIVLVAPGGLITHCTERAAELLGSDPARIEGRHARELMPSIVVSLEPHEIARGVIAPDRAVTYVAQHIAPSATGGGVPRPGLVFRLRSEARFSETRRGQQQLLSALRHDVRSPLTALRGLVGVLQEEPDMPREERLSLLELLRQEAERTVTWVEDYLVLLKLRFESRATQPAALPVGELMRNIETQYAQHAKERGVRFVVQVPASGDDGPQIEGEAALVEPFTKNLIGHFLRLADSGASVSVRLDERGALTVEGYGPGLFAQHPANPFTTLARSTAAGKRTPGVGLGLFLAKKIADVHGWPITVATDNGVVRAIVDWGRRLPEVP